MTSCMCIVAVLVWLYILVESKIATRPRESRLETIRRLYATMVLSFVIALITDVIAFQLLPSGGKSQCLQQGVDCETLHSIIGAAQSYCTGLCPFMLVMPLLYLVQLIANIFNAETAEKEKRKNEAV